jgi:hypothetical protein
MIEAFCMTVTWVVDEKGKEHPVMTTGERVTPSKSLRIESKEKYTQAYGANADSISSHFPSSAT